MRRSGPRTADANQQLLAIIEAELGCLFEFLPVPLLVTSASGEILRANRAAVVFLDLAGPVIHQQLEKVVCSQSVEVVVTVLRHERTVVRLCALQHR